MTQLNVELNGSPASLYPGCTVRELVAQHTGKDIGETGRAMDGTRLGIAVAVNGDIVPRSAWAGYTVPSAARIDLVTAAQGG